MQVGQTTLVAHTDTRGTAFTASGASASVTNPSGDVSTPSATVEPGTSSLSQTISFALTPSMGGVYQVSTQYTDGGDNVIEWSESWWATWTNARAVFNTRLGALGTAVSDGDFYREWGSVALLLLTRWPCIGNGIDTILTLGAYNLLAYPDTAFFDEAATLLVCARLLTPVLTGGAASDITGNDQGDEKHRYADTGRDTAGHLGAPGDAGAGPGGYAGRDERMRYIREAAEKLGMVSTVRQSNTSRADSFNPFAITGPTRKSIAFGNPQSLLSSVVRLLSEQAVIPFGWAGG